MSSLFDFLLGGPKAQTSLAGGLRGTAPPPAGGEETRDQRLARLREQTKDTWKRGYTDQQIKAAEHEEALGKAYDSGPAPGWVVEGSFNTAGAIHDKATELVSPVIPEWVLPVAGAALVLWILHEVEA